MNETRLLLQDRAPAKLNLALHITGLTEGGYHSLRSIMIGLELADSLVIEGSGSSVASPTVRLAVHGGEEDVPTDDRNLVVRAIRAFAEASPGGWPSVLDVRLDKRIPSQAGLGGGSADAGAVLRMLDRARPIGRDHLLTLAAGLGSDVPFMVTGGAALAEGRGERLHALRAPCSWWVVLVQPEERVSTAWAYRQFDERVAEEGPGRGNECVDALSAALQAGHLEGVAGNLYNDLQAVVTDLHPHLMAIPRTLVETGCAGALMTGSGSVFFGLASSRALARDAASKVRAKNLGRTWITRTWRETT